VGEVVRLGTVAEAEHPPREWQRYSTMLKAQLYLKGVAQAVDMVVRNLCSGGLMATSATRLRGGEPVTVSLGRVGQVTGTVAWVDGNRFGVTFERGIDEEIARQPVERVALQPILNHVADARRPGLRIN
jgi:hypothetical protein